MLLSGGAVDLRCGCGELRVMRTVTVQDPEPLSAFWVSV